MLNTADTRFKQEEFEAFLDTFEQVFCRFICYDQTLRLTYVSGAIYGWTGCAPSAFIAHQRNWLDWVHPADRTILLDTVEQARRQHEGFVIDYRLIGEPVRIIRHTARYAGRENGHGADLWNGFLEDITAFRRTQNDLERSQLLQNMGRLSAGIAHEINTPIQFIGDNLHFLAEAWEALCAQYRHLLEIVRQAALEPTTNAASQAGMSFILTEAPDAIRQSLDGIERISALISAMRDFSHLDERRMAAVDLNRAVQSVLTLLRNELKYTVDVQTELDPSLPEVYCSVDEISQAIINLLINAGDSIKEKIEKGLYRRGQISVRTRAMDEWVEISISDDAMGIPADIQPHIFERFFTTKRYTDAKGTGQGLAMVKAIVEQHHRGKLTFQTEIGQGTTFMLQIPVGGSAQKED